MKLGERNRVGGRGCLLRADETLEGSSAVTAACEKRIVDAESSVRIRAWPHV